MMNLEFKPLEAEDIGRLTKFYGIRPNKTCDSMVLDSFLWREYYNVRFAIADDRAALMRMTDDAVEFAAMPMCKEEDLPYYVNLLKEYFNKELGRPLQIFLADEEAVNYLKLPPEEFIVEELDDAKDYLYSGDALRTLSGKKLHKKKNHLNAFLRQYEGRFEYRKLCCSDRLDVWNFLVDWRRQKGEIVDPHLDYEVRGIHEILKNCSILNVSMGGIYVDGKLEAFSIGSYNPLEKMAIIHIEKANADIPGLYQAINQMFLVHEFPQAELVNREDDMGLEGLRHAKMTYNPVGFARKYRIRQVFETGNAREERPAQ